MREVRQTVSHILRHPRLQWPLRVTAGATWFAVAVFSVVPSRDPGASHAMPLGSACAVAALVTRLAFRRTKSRWQLSAFASAAALLMLCRFWLPGKPGAIEGWLACSVGALIGIVIARAVDHLSWRRRPGL